MTAATRITEALALTSHEGGDVFAITSFQHLDRFLILGIEGGTFYCREKEVVAASVKCVAECMALDPIRTVRRIVDVSVRGLNIKQESLLLAYALVAVGSSPEARMVVKETFSRVVRTASHLFTFMTFYRPLCKSGGVFSQSIRKAVRGWYLDKEPQNLSYQLVKYKQRNGWSHRDILRLFRPKPLSPEMKACLLYAVKGELEPAAPNLLHLHRLVHTSGTKEVSLEATGLPWEAYPTEVLIYPEIWRKLLAEKDIPLNAMVRNLGRMTAIGVFKSDAAMSSVINALTDESYVKNSRMHPVSLLIALKTYASGCGERGSMRWEVHAEICDALNEAIRIAFAQVPPLGKRILWAQDVSGSMMTTAAGATNLKACEATSMVALTFFKAEEDGLIDVHGFANDGFRHIPFTKDMTYQQAAFSCQLPFGSTDCSIPFRWAEREGKVYDAIIVATDNETGPKTNVQAALNSYRRFTGMDTKLIVLATSVNDFSIVNPKDTNQIDLVGFSPDIPSVVSAFLRQ